MRDLLRQLYDTVLRQRVAVCLGVGLLLFLPTLNSGFYLDDFWHQALLDASMPGLTPRAFDISRELWSWDTTLPGSAYLQEGSPYKLTWFADPDLEVRFFRPLSAWTLLLNHRIFGRAPYSYHAVNLAIWLLLAATVLELHRRLLPARISRPALLLSGLFFVLADVHSYNVSWISARHGLLDTLFSLLSLLLYDRYRQHGGIGRLVLSLGLFAIALGCGETALATVAWIAAYEIFLARDVVRNRLLAAAPFFALAIGYTIFYISAGYGSHGSSWYLNPFDRPLDYLVAAATRRIPGYLIGSMTLIPAELTQASSPIVMSIGALLLGVVAVVVAPSLRRRPELRFAAAAALGSLPLLCIEPPFTYRMLFPSAAVSLILGVAVTDRVRQLLAMPLRTGPALRLWAATALVLLTHGVGAPLLGESLLLDFVRNTRVDTRRAVWRSMEWPQHREVSDVYLLNSPGTWTSLFLPLEDQLTSERWLRRYIPVSFHAVNTTVTRLDARTLRLESTEGFLSGYFPQSLAALVRRNPPMRAGEDFHHDGFTVAVDRVRDGIPTRLLVRFPRNLDDPDVWLLAFDGTRTLRVFPPKIGGTTRLAVSQPFD